MSGMYYLRTNPSTEPTAVTVPVKRARKEKVVEEQDTVTPVKRAKREKAIEKQDKNVVCTDEVWSA
jgi:hypothetical protein